MKQFLLFSLIAVLCCASTGCSTKSKPATVQSGQSKDTLSSIDSSLDLEFGRYYIVTVAEGTDFPALEKIAKQSAAKLNCKYDNLEREYRLGKGIVDPDSSEDEMYAGEYYPRRPFSYSLVGDSAALNKPEFVSIEMKYAFNGIGNTVSTEDPRMVIVAGIFDSLSTANKVASILQPSFPSTRIVEDSLYFGCMH
jgi:hypothetical protein